jgi:hypothetical protein
MAARDENEKIISIFWKLFLIFFSIFRPKENSSGNQKNKNNYDKNNRKQKQK